MTATARTNRPLLLLAVFLAAVTLLYSILWMTAVRWEHRSLIGFDDFTFQYLENALLVDAVTEDGPAARAGLHDGDRILAVDGRPFDDMAVLRRGISDREPGTVVTLTVARPGESAPREIAVELAPWPGQEAPLAQRLAQEVINSYPLLFFVVGFTVLFLRLRDRHAWLLALMFAAIIGSGPLLDSEAGLPQNLRGFALAFHWLLGGTGGALFYFLLAVFPVSSPLDRRLPWLKWTLLGFQVSVALPLAVAVLVTGDSRALEIADNFIDVNVPWLGPLVTVVTFSSYILGMISLALNTWRAPSAEVRRRTRVILWGLGLGPLPFLVLQLYTISRNMSYFQTPFWVWAPCVLVIFLMPLSVAYAVLKHQVLEVPVLLRRSARYLLVQRGFLLLLVLAGVTVVVVATDLMMSVSGFSAESRQAGVGVALGAALAGVLTVWILGRVHARVASRVDRAFFRSAYDARQILEDLIARSRSARSREELLDLLQRRVGEALQPTFLLVYLRDDDRLALVGGTPAAALTGAPTAFATASDFVQALVARGRPLTVGEDDLPLVPGVVPSSAAAVECLVPVLDRDGSALGLLVLGPRRSEEPYSGEDRRLVAGVAGQLGLSLESLDLAEDIAHRIEDERRAAHEMEVARRVQVNLLPQAAPELRSLELAAHCVQARAVGGDFYDYLALGPERLGLVLADISGKGMSAALLMSSLQAMVRSRTTEIPRDAVGVLQEINDRLLDTTTAGQFATLFLGDYDDVSRRFRYVNCGHNPPLLLRRDGNLEQLDATATVLGAFESWPCEGAEVELEAGDLLVIYSDGVTEVSNEQGEMFGEQRLAEVVRAHRAVPIDDLVAAILCAVAAHGAEGPEDDLTLLTARVCPSPVLRENADTHTDLATT